jgi:hypothetical protein
LGITFSTEAPACFGQSNGSIILTDVQGGAGPFAISVNEMVVQVTDVFPVTLGGLESGLQIIGVEDANGCLSDAEAEVPTPAELIVDLGLDTTIHLGESVVLQANVNTTPLASFTWSSAQYLNTTDSLVVISTPLNSIRYTVEVTDTAGCRDSDDILVIVKQDKRVFIPNILQPTSDNFNNMVTVFGGAEVTLVRSMQIYDRWGELVFENRNFLPNDPQSGWNGQAKGEYVNPGVFVYVVEVAYINGETEILSGDITVTR